MTNHILDRQKFESASKRVKYPKRLNITDAGRAAIEADPNLDDHTMSLLWDTEWPLLSEQEAQVIETLAPQELVDSIFLNNDETGLAHLTQCISEDHDQSLAELVARYAMERQIPFFAGAWYIKALMMRQGLFYYQYSVTRDLHRKSWTPKEKYFPPAPIVPPAKPKRKRKAQETAPACSASPGDTVEIGELQACPVCQAAAKIIRCGKGLSKYTACCTDPDKMCINYLGLPGYRRSSSAAVKAWDRYCASYRAAMRSTG